MGTASSLTSFGHFGQNSSMLWGDSAHDVVVVMTTYLILSAEEISHRFPEIADSV
jgi:hypothetical protein